MSDAVALRNLFGQVHTLIQEVLDENDELRWQLEQLKAGGNNRKKLSTKDAAHIRELVHSGYSRREVAHAYDVNPSTVSRIVRGIYH